MTKLTTLTGDIDARDLAQIRDFADHMMQGDTPTQTNNRMQPIETAPQNIPVIVSGGISIKDSAGDWWSCMTVPQRKLQWAPGWWAPISYTGAPPQWTREDLIDALADVISDTHDMDVRDVDYARNVVDWIDQNLMPIPEDKE